MACKATLKGLGCFYVVVFCYFVYLPEVSGRDFEQKKNSLDEIKANPNQNKVYV